MPFAGFYLRLLPTCFSHLMNFCLLFSCKLVTSFSMPRYCWFVNFSASWTFSFQVSICGLASRIFVLSLSASGSNPRPPSHMTAESSRRWPSFCLPRLWGQVLSYLCHLFLFNFLFPSGQRLCPEGLLAHLCFPWVGWPQRGGGH